MPDFHDSIANSAVVDAGYVGSPYTWYSRLLHQHLDRALVSSYYVTVFPKMQKQQFQGTIFGIRHDGEYLTDSIAIKNSVASFFQRLLTAEPVFPEEMDSEYLEDGLTDEDRRSLCIMPTLKEVWEAVFSIDLDSVAGPDGFGAAFFDTCWEIISEDVFAAVTEFFHGVEMPKCFTAITICLISKRTSPACWSPITVAKWFVPGRLLSDNVLLAQELIHSLESRRPEANVVFQLDMA
ncbi:UNVERIFIED_CONTAM: hypothetical protein Sangu_3176600 [Sesamum angustifolium]|uniref:Uncharacterized protein n=1 Tax=Sesamum angustifolium TaxID=2727405 RepID=A0AAW2JT71_9LAMI